MLHPAFKQVFADEATLHDAPTYQAQDPVPPSKPALRLVPQVTKLSAVDRLLARQGLRLCGRAFGVELNSSQPFAECFRQLAEVSKGR